ncbi:response regulator transcription factor [Streptomyces sp. NPDC051211]|uniref:response regulator transcription factor n=1 Tax=Streptomyces sp. NPDC051211 TaxID=3154643 RepID=UPI0034505BAE
MEINLLIVGDNPVTLAGLEAIIDQDERFTLIGGRAMNDTEATRCLEETELQPQVIILAEPSSKSSLCADVHHFTSKYPSNETRPKTFVVSQNDDDDVIVSALRIGVQGYLARIESPEELLHSIQIVAKGGAAFSPTIAARFSTFFSTMQSLPELTGFSDLTDRELEVLELVAGGLGNRQIARRLFLAEKTVRNYISRIFAKLEVHDRTTAAVRARDAGLGEPTGMPVPQRA